MNYVCLWETGPSAGPIVSLFSLSLVVAQYLGNADSLRSLSVSLPPSLSSLLFLIERVSQIKIYILVLLQLYYVAIFTNNLEIELMGNGPKEKQKKATEKDIRGHGTHIQGDHTHTQTPKPTDNAGLSGHNILP